MAALLLAGVVVGVDGKREANKRGVSATRHDTRIEARSNSRRECDDTRIEARKELCQADAKNLILGGDEELAHLVVGWLVLEELPDFVLKPIQFVTHGGLDLDVVEQPGQVVRDVTVAHFGHDLMCGRCGRSGLSWGTHVYSLMGREEKDL